MTPVQQAEARLIIIELLDDIEGLIGCLSPAYTHKETIATAEEFLKETES